jgi:2',3'-cyclic-nucleotide 2'-phosphodiesterase (5'-nucleotidase family)
MRRLQLYLALLALCLCTAVFGQAADPEPKVNRPTGPLLPTTKELIAPDVLAAHQTATLLILHSNDIHDILKAPDGDAPGGIATLSAYVHDMKAKRPDVLMLDAGDLLQKGDLMSVVSKGEVAYRSLGMIGCDLTVPGNHDFAYGVAAFRKNLELAGISAVCAGMDYTDTGESVFPPYKMFTFGKLRVGVIGATAPVGNPNENGRAIRKLPGPELGQRVHQIALELKPRVDLLICLLHNGTGAALGLSKAAPEIPIFVCGHSNEVTQAPIVSPSGALITEVGRAGQWLGSLDLTFDLDEHRIGKWTFQMVEMDRDAIEPDAALERQLSEWERQWCPDAVEVLATAPQGLKGPQGGQLGEPGAWIGQAVLDATGADVALFHREFIRRGLPAGEVTADDLYKLVQPRYAKTLVRFSLSGAQLRTLLELCLGRRGEHLVGNIHATADRSAPEGSRVSAPDLDPAKTYTVAALHTHIVPPPQHDVGIADILQGMDVTWRETTKTVVDMACDFARKQKTIVAPGAAD